MRSKCGADCHTLLLTTTQRAQRALPDLVEGQQVDDLLSAASHDCGIDAQAFHAESQFILGCICHEASNRILHDHAHHIGESARRIGARIAIGHTHVSVQLTTGEVRH